MKKVTMQVIANKLSFSKNTVSQALSGRHGVSDETRKLIKKTADELGYINKKETISCLDVEKSRNIALIASEFAFAQKSFFGEIYISIDREIRARKKNLLIESINKDDIESLCLPTVLEKNEIDGILILSHMSTEYISKIIETGIPTVIIDHHDPDIKADSVLSNNRFAAYSAVEYMIKLGHKKISFVGNTSFSPSYQERLEGYLLALKKNNIPNDSAFIFEDIKDDLTAVKNLLDCVNEEPTAFFCVNDCLGFLVLSELQQRGFNIPRDFSICSFDNGQFSQMASPKITTVDINLNYFGKKSVEQICWRMHNKNKPVQEILLPTKLIVKESTARVSQEIQ